MRLAHSSIAVFNHLRPDLFRGSLTGLLRQYFPKHTDFKKVSQTAVHEAVERLNARPRKGLMFKTPDQLMEKYMAALAA